MTTGANGIPQRLLQQVYRGLMQEDEGPEFVRIIEEVGRVEQVGAFDGSYPLEPTESTLQGGVGDGIDAGVEPGSPMETTDAELIDIDYNLLQFHHAAKLPDAKRVNWRDATGESLVENRLSTCQTVANLKVDLHVDERLTNQIDSDDNKEVDVTSLGGGNAAWNTSSGTPVSDVRMATISEVPGADTLLIGAELASEMATNAEFAAKVNSYSGAGVTEDQMVDTFLSEVKSLENVEIVEAKYNVNQEGEDAEISYAFGQEAWLGYGRDLALFTLDSQEINNPQAVQEYRELEGYTVMAWKRFHELQRPSKDLGARLTNVYS